MAETQEGYPAIGIEDEGPREFSRTGAKINCNMAKRGRQPASQMKTDNASRNKGRLRSAYPAGQFRICSR